MAKRPSNHTFLATLCAVWIVTTGWGTSAQASVPQVACVQENVNFNLVFKADSREAVLDLRTSGQQAVRSCSPECIEKNQKRCETLRTAFFKASEFTQSVQELRFTCESTGYNTYYPDEDIGLKLMIFPADHYDAREGYSISTLDYASGAAARVQSCAQLKSDLARVLKDF